MDHRPKLRLVPNCGRNLMAYDNPASRLSLRNKDKFSSSTAGGIPFFPQFQTRWRDEIPSRSAKAVGPPACAITSLDSSGVMPPCTPGLYSSQDGLYPFDENGLYCADVHTDKEICDYIFELAKRSHVSQVAIARACGKSRQAVTNWKDAGVVPTANLRAIATLLNTTVDGLLTLGRNTPVVNLTSEELERLPSDTKDLVIQAVKIIDTAMRNSAAARAAVRRTK